MGCDIHAYVEYKKPYSDEWIHYDVDEGVMGHRNYSLFSILAGVRSYYAYPAINEPRGLPEDASAFIMREYGDWPIDWHSASYFTLAELRKAYPKYTFTHECNPLDHFVSALEQHAANIFKPMSMFDEDYTTKYADHIRTVFWFNN